MYVNKLNLIMFSKKVTKFI